jgi:hypothetical protein
LKILAFPLALVKSIIEKLINQKRLILNWKQVFFPRSNLSLMTIYALICLCLSLAGVAGLQFFYLAYLERMDKETRKNLRDTERQNQQLKQRLLEAELQIAQQAKIIESTLGEQLEDEEEVWADVIDDR